MVIVELLVLGLVTFMDNCPPIDGVVVSWTIVHEIKYLSLSMNNSKISWTIAKFQKIFAMSNLNCISKVHRGQRNDNPDNGCTIVHESYKAPGFMQISIDTVTTNLKLHATLANIDKQVFKKIWKIYSIFLFCNVILQRYSSKF